MPLTAEIQRKEDRVCPPDEIVMDYSVAINTLWVLLGAALMFFMQAGFAMLEAGFTRSKNTGNIVMKNLIDFAVGSICFLFVGYGLMYGVNEGGWFGRFHWFSDVEAAGCTIPKYAHVIYNTMFCATSATIVSGALAERTKFKAYFIYSIVISAVVFPISASWVWGGGWLSAFSIGGTTGFHDYAGSALVHMVGGISALIGAKAVGPRNGKYGKDGNVRAIPGHNIALGALGVFILWFGWFGFNGASGYGIASAEQTEAVAAIFLNTNISAASSVVAAVLFTWLRYGKPDVSMSLNAAVAGLVAITAGCDCLDPWAACIVGVLAGILMVIGIEWVERCLKIDDPVGAICVHGLSGIIGTLAVGIFSRENGLLTTGGWQQLAIQAVGILAIGVWTAGIMSLLFFLLKKTVGIRVSTADEVAGLDISEHGMRASYSDFFQAISYTDTIESGEKTEKVLPEMAIPVTINSSDRKVMDQARLTKVVILARQSKFEELKDAMNEIGVTGMTVTQVLGCGMQRGHQEYYRGAEIDSMQLLPKIQVDIIVSKVPVRKVVDAAKKVLYTGHIGDGKIFVYDVQNAIKIRTGEEGYYAMQGVDE